MRDREPKAGAFAKDLRSHLTDAEKILWSKLREGRRQGIRFRRQHPIGPYIADFACARANLVIEVDGATHASDAERTHDERRDAYMRDRGWHVLRFWNHDIYRNLNEVVDSIFAVATSFKVPDRGTATPSVSPLRGDPPPPLRGGDKG